jgi:hypothetical protein
MQGEARATLMQIKEQSVLVPNLAWRVSADRLQPKTHDIDRKKIALSSS